MTLEQQFSDVLHAAMADVHPPADLVQAGMARGRRMRRNRLLMTSGATAAAIVTVIAAGTSVLGAIDEPPTPSTATKKPVRPLDAKLISIVLGDLMPKGTVRLMPERSEAADSGNGGLSGSRTAGSIDFDDGNGLAAISVRVQRVPDGEPSERCLPIQIRPYDYCKKTTLRDGSELVVGKSYANPRSNKGGRVWYASLMRKDRFQVWLEQYNSVGKGARPTRPNPPLSIDQMTAVVIDPAWAKLADRLLVVRQLPPGGGPSTKVNAPPEPEPPGGRLGAALKKLLPRGMAMTGPRSSDGNVSALLDDGKGRAMISVAAHHETQQTVPECAARIKADPVQATCRKVSLQDGSVAWLQQYTAGTGIKVRQVDVLTGGGLRVVVTVANGTSLNGPKTREGLPLTMDQLTAIATDEDSWYPA